MTKTLKLNLLFDEWENFIPACKNYLVRDGIINETIWNITSPKILFIAKEPNQFGNPKKGDFREEWSSGNSNYLFANTIADWTFGIIEGFKKYNEIAGNQNMRKQYLQKIALLNVKKIGGLSKCDEVALWKHMQLDGQAEFIRREIEVIDPDLIVLGLSFNNQIKELIFPGILDEIEQCGYMIEVAKYKKWKIIDFYHPSSRSTGPATYSLLQNVMNSDIYKGL